MRSSVVLIPLLVAEFVFAACGVSGAGASTAVLAPIGRQLIVAIDLSGSRTVEAMEADRRLLNTIAASLDYGDEIVLMRIPEVSGRDPLTMTRTVPRRQSPQHSVSDDRQRAAIREDVASDIKKILVPTENARHSQTDIIGALFAASDRARESGGRPTMLVLLSDMVQEGRDLNFTHAVPNADWIQTKKKAGLIPVLTGVCVSAVGPNVSTDEGVKIRSFWAAYFQAGAAKFTPDRYRRTVTAVETLFCLVEAGTH